MAMLRSCAGLATALRPAAPVVARAVPVRAPLGFRQLATQASYEQTDRRVAIYTAFTVYKSKGAMSLKVIKPTWEPVATGSGGLRLARDGTVLLEFAASKGTREYDWDRKETFALSALECGELLEVLEAGREAAMYHDPSRGSSEEGLIGKQLRVSPAPDAGYYFSLSVSDKRAAAGNGQARLSTSVAPSELRVVRTLLEFAIPRLLGFDELFNGHPEVRMEPEAGGAAPPF